MAERTKEDHISSVARLLGIGAVVGASAGFVLGLLLAPEEGSRLRRRITYHLDGVRKILQEIVKEGLPQSLDAKQGKNSQALVTEVHERAQEISERIDAVLEDVQNRGKQ